MIKDFESANNLTQILSSLQKVFRYEICSRWLFTKHFLDILVSFPLDEDERFWIRIKSLASMRRKPDQ